MRIVISIKPQFVEKIFEGSKKFEYRKSIFKKRDIQSVLVYSTLPVGKLVGEFKIMSILKDEPNKLWERTHIGAGIDKLFFDSYFKNRNIAFAIEIIEPVLYQTPISLSELQADLKAPQSYLYLR